MRLQDIGSYRSATDPLCPGGIWPGRHADPVPDAKDEQADKRKVAGWLFGCQTVKELDDDNDKDNNVPAAHARGYEWGLLMPLDRQGRTNRS
jgi:hypothetical protein